MSIIKIKDLTYTYSSGTPFEKTAVDNVSIDIEKGEFVGVIGHTGSGKSTLIQHINGLLAPTSGEIFIDGEKLWENKARLREIRFKVGLVFQYPEYQLFEETVYKDVAFGPKNMGCNEKEIDKMVRTAISQVGLGEDVLDKSPFDLSGGQKRRVAIAGVIAMQPKVLILDEPTAGLDPKGRDQILELIKEYHQQEGNTVLLVSHSMEDIAKYASKGLVMNKAKLYMYDTIDNIFSHSKEIENMGLNVPQITRVFLRLKEKGYNFNENIYTIEQAKQAICSALKGGTI